MSQISSFATLKQLATDLSGWSNCNSFWAEEDVNGTVVGVVGAIDEDGETYPLFSIDCSQYYQDQDSVKLAEFSAITNPAYILQLINTIERLQTQIDQQKRWIETHQTQAKIHLNDPILQGLKEKFTSTNSIPVTRSTITIEEYTHLMGLINQD